MGYVQTVTRLHTKWVDGRGQQLQSEVSSVAAKILVVDDSSLSRRRFVAKPLRDAGYEVVEAENGQKGLEAAKEHNPDCIVSDLLMPILDGFGFLAALKESGNTTPVIVASADIQQTSKQKITDLGAAGFLNKPFSKEDLLELVSNVMASTEKGIA